MTRCPPRSTRRATGSRPALLWLYVAASTSRVLRCTLRIVRACVCSARVQLVRFASAAPRWCSAAAQEQWHARPDCSVMFRVGVYAVQNAIPSGALQARRKAHCGPSSSVAQAAACATGWSAAAPADRPEPCSAAAPGRRWCSGYNSRLAHLTSRTRDRASPSDKAQRVRLSRAPHARANR